MKKVLLALSFVVVCGLSALTAQTRTITGTVTGSDDGMPIPGASVFVKGTTMGTVTQINGSYSLNVPADAQTLVFSFVGMQTQEQPVAGRTVIDVILSSDAIRMDEVVVTGYGVATDRRRVAISVERVSEEDLNRVTNASIDGALIGRIAGAQIQSTSGQPGQQANIILRGINTLGSTQPMILVDGVEINSRSSAVGTGNFSSRLADIDLSNVERVEVVQGAAAATIYGAQGANGVIHIFTKRGRISDRPTITFSSNVSIDNALSGNLKIAKNHYYATNADGYIMRADGSGPISVDENTGYWTLPNETITPTSNNINPFKETTYNHFDQYFKSDVVTYTNSINIAGAREGFDYSFSVAHLNQESPIHGNYERKNLTLNLGTELFKGFTLRTNTQLINSENTAIGINNRNNIYSGLSGALMVPQYVDLKFKDTVGNYAVNYDAGSNSVSPFYTYQNRSFKNEIYRGIQGINLNYKVTDFLEFDYKFGVDHYRFDYEDFIRNQRFTQTPGKGISPYDGQLVKRRIQETQQNSLFAAFLKLNFERDFGIDIPIESTTQFAYDWRRQDYNRIEGTGTNYSTTPPFTLATGGTSTNDEYISTFVTFGYLLNQKFDYANLTGFSVGIRSDYSSAFGEGSKPFTFPRGDVYFRFSEIMDISSIYEFKLRAAYGEAGIQPNPYDRLITLSSETLSGNTLLYLNAIARNPELGVEKSKEFEIGLDYGVTLSQSSWMRRLSGSLVYWNRESEGSIYTIDVAPSTGAAGITTNAINLTSDGIQLSLDLDAYDSRDFKWTLGTRFSTTSTMVDKISNGQPIVIGTGGSGQTLIKEGEPVGAFFGVKPLTSLTETNSLGERYISDADLAGYQLVDGMVVNVASKQVQFTTEQEKIGDATPDFSLSFFNDFVIKRNLSISMQLDWIKGQQAYNQTRQWLYRDRIHGDFDKQVTIGEGNEATGAWVAYHQSLYKTNQANAFFVEDASFLRLRSVSVAYDFAPLVNISGIKGLTLSFTGRNLLTITDYSGIDPEAVGTQLNDPLYRGIDLWSFPNMKSYQFGLNVKF